MQRTFRQLIFIVLTVAFFVFGSHRAQAQCANANINSAYQTALHRSPRGSGNSGECNPAYYGGGAWASQADLVKRVGAASYCSNNPWIGQIYLYEYNRYPNVSECNANYGYNGSMSYMGLDSQIRAYVAGGERAGGASAVLRPPVGSYLVNSSLALIDWNGTTVANPGSYVIAAGGANSPNGVIAAGGANSPSGVVSPPQAGWIIAPDPSVRSVQSVGGRRVIVAKSITK